MPRRDRREPAKDIFGKQDVSYPDGSFDHPRVTEEASIRTTDKRRKAFLSKHETIKTALKTGDDASPGDNHQVNLTEVFDTLPGPLLTGQRYDRATGFVTPFTEQKTVAGVALGNANTEITPLNAILQEVRIETPPAAAILASYISGPGYASFSLPNTLRGISVTYNKSNGSGVTVEPSGVAVANGPSVNVSFSPSTHSQGSAAIAPDAQPDIVPTPADNVPSVHHFFYLAGNPTIAQVLAKVMTLLVFSSSGIVAGVVTTTTAHGLSTGQAFQFVTVTTPGGATVVGTTYYAKTITDNTHFTYSLTQGGATVTGGSATAATISPVVLVWPRFKPEPVILTLKGQRASVSAAAHIQESLSASVASSPPSLSYSQTGSTGTSQEVGVTIDRMVIAPTIHGAITLTKAADASEALGDNHDAITASAQASATAPVLTGTSGVSLPTFTVSSVAPTKTAAASVTPSTIPATSPASIPTSGLYVREPNFSPAEWVGYARIHVETVDFSYFA